MDIANEGSLSDAFTKLTGRKPQKNEQRILEDMFATELKKFQSNEEKINSWIPKVANVEIKNSDKAKIASYAVVISTIMNTDATIVKR